MEFKFDAGGDGDGEGDGLGVAGGEAAGEVDGEAGDALVPGQHAALPVEQPPPYWDPEVSGEQDESVQQYGLLPALWHGTAPKLPASSPV